MHHTVCLQSPKYQEWQRVWGVMTKGKGVVFQMGKKKSIPGDLNDSETVF